MTHPFREVVRMGNTLFVAGATGGVGRTLMKQALAAEVDVVPHVRPKSAGAAGYPNPAILELSEHDKLVAALRGRSTVLQLIGTVRKRFKTGDTYETSDIGTTQQLVEAAREAGVGHVVLLSSIGAGKPRGAYLKAKAEAERLVRESGLAWTIFRPSAFEGEGYPKIPGLRLLTRLAFLRDYAPITLDELASALLHVALQGEPTGRQLEGEPLWEQVRAAAPLRR